MQAYEPDYTNRYVTKERQMPVIHTSGSSSYKATLHNLVQAYEPDHTDRYVTKERHLFTLVTLTLMKKEKAEKRAERKKEKQKVTAEFHIRAKIWN